MLETCPTDVFAATPQIIWPLLTRRDKVDRWVDAKVMSASAGPLAEGDVVTFRAGSLGIFRVRWVVGRVIEPRELTLHVELPFGVVNNEVIVITPLPRTKCRVTFN